MDIPVENPAILCLNSHVAYGYVGNDAAAFCLRRLGVEAWQLDTVALSNHPGHGACTGRVVPTAELAALLDGLVARRVLAGCGGVLAGYLGAAEQGRAVRDAFARVRAEHPRALRVLDPVMGDLEPGFYVQPEIARVVAEDLVPLADAVTPNAFELGRIAGQEVRDRDSALAAARTVLTRGPRLVLATSLPAGDAQLEMLAVTHDEAWSLAVPRLHFATAPNGAGDALAGLFAGHLVRGADVPTALTASANAIHAILEATRTAGRRELALVAAQRFIAAPPERFRAHRVVGGTQGRGRTQGRGGTQGRAEE